MKEQIKLLLSNINYDYISVIIVSMLIIYILIIINFLCNLNAPERK